MVVYWPPYYNLNRLQTKWTGVFDERGLNMLSSPAGVTAAYDLNVKLIWKA